jgi:hypothetical protein
VTVTLKMGNLLEGKLYITRREIYGNRLTLNSNGNLHGYVEDTSEQFVIGASRRILAQQSKPVQKPDPGMNPIILVRASDDLDTCEELMQNRHRLFPAEPEFR